MSKELVLRRLREFYAEHCPSKVDNVENTYEGWKSMLPELFDQLCKKYNVHPDYFKDIRQFVSCYSAEKGRRLTKREVQQLLLNGERLLTSSPAIPPKPEIRPQNDDLPVHAELSEYDNAILEKKDKLQQLRDENGELIEEVSLAEQLVIQKRLESMAEECASIRKRRERIGKEDLLTVIVKDSKEQVLHFPADSSFWRFVHEGIATIPVHHTAATCTIATTNSEFANPPVIVAKTALAVAMRAWTKYNHHTVSSRTRDNWHFTSGEVFWREWPSPVIVCSSIPPEALFKATTEPSNKLGPSSVSPYRGNNSGRGRPVNIAKETKELFVNPHAASAGYWEYFMDEWRVLQKELNK